MQTNEFLAAKADAFEVLSKRLHKATCGLTEAQLNERIPGFHWTIGQVVDHLLVSADLYESGIVEAYALSKSKGPEPLRFSRFGAALTAKAGPNGNAPVFSKMRPTNEPVPLKRLETLKTLFQGEAQRSRAHLDAAISSTKMRNPVFPIFRQSLADTIELLERHGEHHMRQIETYAPVVLVGSH